MKISRSILLCGMYLSVVAWAEPLTIAQAQPAPTSEAAEPIPPEVASALAATPVRTGIFAVSGNVTYEGQVLKVDELVLQSGSYLEFTNTSLPWVAIIAKRIRFINPSEQVTIGWGSARATEVGSSGSAGRTGGRRRGRGADGRPGGRGTDGGPGQSTKTPDVYIYAGSVEVTGQAGPLSLPNLRLQFTGFQGGPGGVGGDGGRGGNGRNGRDSKSNTFDCKRGAQGGGDGGAGGPGGSGGNGAPGSDGPLITIVASQSSADLLTSGELLTAGGAGGLGGAGGKGGRGGSGGAGGDGSRHCNSASSGTTGSRGAVGRSGTSGAPGRPGSVVVVPLTAMPADILRY